MRNVIQIVCMVVIGLGSVAMAKVNIETVPVGNAGNADDTHGAEHGGVPYTYNIGKYEVTAGQYCDFLNAVAATDTYGLYRDSMGWGSEGCRIQRTVSSGGYTYSVASNRANRPVNYVSWGDAARFVNWLHNGQPSGGQDLSTTEDGAYYLNGATSGAALMAVSREADWTWAIPSGDEWYKAAYYKGGGINAGYWDYPTQSDSRPTAERPSGTDLVNGSANFYDSGYVDRTYWTTEVGAYDAKPSDSAYGTFDQGGNVSEWTERTEPIDGLTRGLWGGSFGSAGPNLEASDPVLNSSPRDEFYTWGFRVAEVPEPATLGMLALGGLAMLRRRRSCGGRA